MEFSELEGIANRTDFDLSTHAKHAGVDLTYFDQDKGERWTPYVIEPSGGLTRSLLASCSTPVHVDEAPNAKGGVDTRTVMRFDARPHWSRRRFCRSPATRPLAEGT